MNNLGGDCRRVLGGAGKQRKVGKEKESRRLIGPRVSPRKKFRFLFSGTLTALATIDIPTLAQNKLLRNLSFPLKGLLVAVTEP